MANLYGPRIVTDGLVLCLDAGNNKSYPGTGTSWFDLSGNNSHGSLGSSTAAPTFLTENRGCFSFDGSNDIISGNLSASITEMTLCCFASIVGENNAGILGIGNQGTYKEAWIELLSNSNFKFGLYANDLAPGWSTALSLSNVWAFYCASIDSSQLQKGYVNGKLVGTYQGSQSYSGNTTYRVGFGRSTAGQYVAGKIATCYIYNKALTASEIQQNYNALQKRFG